MAWVDGRLQLLRHGALTTVDVPNEAFRTGLRVTMNSHDAVGVGAFVWSSHGGWTARARGVRVQSRAPKHQQLRGDRRLEWCRRLEWFGTAATSAKVRYADGTIVELPKPTGFTPGTEVFVSPAQINDAGIVVGYPRGTIAGAGVNRATVWRPTK